MTPRSSFWLFRPNFLTHTPPSSPHTLSTSLSKVECDNHVDKYTQISDYTDSIRVRVLLSMRMWNEKKKWKTKPRDEKSEGTKGIRIKMKTKIETMKNEKKIKQTNNDKYEKYVRYFLGWRSPWDIIVKFIVAFVAFFAFIVARNAERRRCEHVRHR